MERVPVTKRRFVLKCAIFVVLCTLVSVGESAGTTNTFLGRYPVRATDALGAQLMEMFGRLQQVHFSGPRPNPAGSEPAGGAAANNPVTNTPRPVSTRVPKGTLPGGSVTVPPEYDTVINGPANPTSLIVVLHGMGGTPEQLTALENLSKEELPRTRFVFVRAPRARVTYIGRVLNSWFDISKRVAGRENVEELRNSAAGISRIINAQKRIYKFSDDKVVVVGMSQGGAVALTFYLAERERVAGVIGAATWLPLPTLWKKESIAAENDFTPIHIIHGVKDSVIKIGEAKKSAEILRGLGREVTYREYPGAGHSMVERFGVVIPDLIAKSKEMLGE